MILKACSYLINLLYPIESGVILERGEKENPTPLGYYAKHCMCCHSDVHLHTYTCRCTPHIAAAVSVAL